MTASQIVTLLVRCARDNAREAREYRRKWGYSDTMGRWHKGRAAGLMLAARMVSGRDSAYLRNLIRRAA